MTEKELERRIRDLERRVKELEQEEHRRLVAAISPYLAPRAVSDNSADYSVGSYDSGTADSGAYAGIPGTF